MVKLAIVRKQVEAESLSSEPSSRDELNLAEFPFCLLTGRTYRERASITVERQVFDPATGRTARQAWTATGNEKHGLPTARDMDVYVALMQIAGRDGIDRDRKVYFSRYELVKMQGRTPCQPTYEQLERSLKRLVGVTIYAEDAFFDAKTRRRTSQAFGILDNYKLEDCSVREARAGAKQLEFRFHRSWVVLNTVLNEQLQRGGIKNLDAETYFSLDYPVSRRLYRFLDRVRDERAASYEIELGALARLMPLHDSRPSRQLRDLEKAHKELEKTGYLAKVEQIDAKEGKKLVYTFKVDARAELLTARGISPAVARRLVDRFPDRIAAKVDAFDRLVKEKKGTIQNPAGFLRCAIEDDWSPAPATRAAASKANAASTPTRGDGRSGVFGQQRILAALFRSLAPDTQHEIDERAHALARAELPHAAAGNRRFELLLARKREEILRAEFRCEPGDL